MKTFGFELFRVSSSSMEPALLVGDYVLVAKYPYGYTRYSFPWDVSWSGVLAPHTAQRGDIVVFHQPHSVSNPWIKRVVGLPGEKISLTHGALCVEGTVCPLLAQPFTKLYEEVLPGDVRYHVSRTQMPGASHLDHRDPFVVPEGAYFVLGDARDASQDSRHPEVGSVAHNQLLGRAVRILFSQAPKGDLSQSWWSRLRWDRFFKALS